MFGAIFGDIVGSTYEFHPCKRTDFPLLPEGSVFTDDTVMTLAVADALMDITEQTPEDQIRQRIIAALRWYGRRHPDAGYGGSFRKWLKTRYPKPYNSWGNGSAMRVSAAGWLFGDPDTVRRMARLSAEVTHNHPEGIKGAEATASAIFLARTGSSKAEIRAYIEENFQYDLSRTCDGLRPDYGFEVSCQKSVPESIIAFLDAESFEQTIRLAVSLGGDADTQAAIAGSIAEGFYGVPEQWKEECRRRLPEDLREVLTRFAERISG